MISVKSDIKEASKILKGYEREAIPKAVVPSLNRATKSAQSVGIKKIAQVTKLKQKDVRKAIAPYFSKARRGRWYAIVDSSKGRAVNLIKFVTPSKQNPLAFRARTKRGFKFEGVVANAWGQRRTYPGTFIGRGAGHGKMLVFKRGEGNKVKAVFGPSIRREFDKPEVQRVMALQATERFGIEYKRTLDYQLKKVKQRYQQ